MDFYENNFKAFSDTRHCLWRSVEEFSHSFNESSIVLDAGCGNGKNMKHLEGNVGEIIGFDSCKNFVRLCKEKCLNVIEGDIRTIPYCDEKFDFIICVAVIHHLRTEAERVLAMYELLRVLKPGGKLLVTSWAVENDKFSQKRKFVKGDNNVLFNGEDRYYYVHDKESFNLYCNKFPHDKEVFWDKGNWNVIFTK